VGTLTFDPGKAYELGVKVGDDAEVKHPIAAVPVALNAKKADSATTISGVLPVASGGTGSATQNFVDLSSAQTIGGAKTSLMRSGVTTACCCRAPRAALRRVGRAHG
jgi:hypothetical protein